MAVQLTPHPAWVAELDAALEPHRREVLDTPVVVDASENRLMAGDRKSTRLNSSHIQKSRMPSSA